jgi:hypothetical protein
MPPEQFAMGGCLARGNVVTTQSGSQSRTITGYLVNLLEYPRWLIERDTDFTHCPYHGRYERFVVECDACVFGKGCYWLSSYTAGETREAPLTDLVDALENAIEYVARRPQVKHSRDCACDDCEWLRSSRRFLRSLPDHIS